MIKLECPYQLTGRRKPDREMMHYDLKVMKDMRLKPTKVIMTRFKYDKYFAGETHFEGLPIEIVE